MEPESAQVARTRRELFPDAPDDGPLVLVAPKDVAWSPRRWATIIAVALLPGVLLLVELLLRMPVHFLVLWIAGPHAMKLLAVGWTAVAVTLAVAFGAAWVVLVVANRWGVQDGPRVPWDAWSRARGLVRVPARVVDQVDVPMLDRTALGPQSGLRGWLARSPVPPLSRGIGARHVFAGTLGREGELVIVGAARWMRVLPSGDPEGTDDVRTVRACFAAVQLPEQVAEVFPASRVTRIFRSLRTTPAGEDDPAGRLAPEARTLDLESIDFHETARVEIAGGDDVTWRRLFDPTLLAALAHDLDVEFQQRGRWLIVAMPARDWWRGSARSARMDTLCAAARLLEVRFTREAVTIALAQREEMRRSEAARRVDVHLARERARDIELAPGQLFAELAVLVSPAELALVRAKVDAGTFPLEWLDDLVHHRRAERLGRHGRRAA